MNIELEITAKAFILVLPASKLQEQFISHLMLPLFEQTATFLDLTHLRHQVRKLNISGCAGYDLRLL